MGAFSGRAYRHLDLAHLRLILLLDEELLALACSANARLVHMVAALLGLRAPRCLIFTQTLGFHHRLDSRILSFVEIII